MQRVKTGISYIIAQCVGGVVGAYAAFNLLPGQHPLSYTYTTCCSSSFENRFMLALLSLFISEMRPCARQCPCAFNGCTAVFVCQVCLIVCSVRSGTPCPPSVRLYAITPETGRLCCFAPTHQQQQAWSGICTDAYPGHYVGSSAHVSCL